MVPAGHPLAQQEQVTLEQLSRERLVIYNQASPTRNLVLSMFRQQDLQPDVAFEVATDHMLASFVSQGLGVGIMPRMFGLRLYSVRPLYIADTETHRMLYMFRPKDRRVLPRSSGSGTLCWRSAPSTSLTNRYGKARSSPHPRGRTGSLLSRRLTCPGAGRTSLSGAWSAAAPSPPPPGQSPAPGSGASVQRRPTWAGDHAAVQGEAQADLGLGDPVFPGQLRQQGIIRQPLAAQGAPCLHQDLAGPAELHRLPLDIAGMKLDLVHHGGTVHTSSRFSRW